MEVTKEMVLERWDYLEKVLYEIGANTYEIIYSKPVPLEEVSELQLIAEHHKKCGTNLYRVARIVNRYYILLRGKGILSLVSFAIIPAAGDNLSKLGTKIFKDESKWTLTEQFIKGYITFLLTTDIPEYQKLLLSRDIYNYYIYRVEGRKDFCYAPYKLPDSDLFELLKQSRDNYLQNFADNLNRLAKEDYMPIRERIKLRKNTSYKIE